MRVVKVEKAYECPVCKRKFSSPATLISHARRRHRLVLLTEFQSQVYDVCKKLSEGRDTFTTSDVIRTYRRNYGKRKVNEIKRSLIALSNKGLLECVEVRKGGEFVWELKK